MMDVMMLLKLGLLMKTEMENLALKIYMLMWMVKLLVVLMDMIHLLTMMKMEFQII